MRRSGKFLAAALSFALVLATPLSAQATKSGLSDAKSKKTALEAEKKKTEQELKNLEGLKSDTTTYVKKLDSSLESIGNELSKLNDDIDAKEKQIDTTKQELSEARDTEDYYRHVIAEKFAFEKRLIVSTLKQHGIYSLLTTPENLSIDVINKYLEMKSRQLL